MNIKTLIPAVVCMSAALAACNSAESDWSRATAANTMSGYQAFLQEHADSKHAENARGRILALLDDQAWNAARAANSIAGYQDYLKAQSGGIHAGEAKYQITALQRAAAWQALPSDASASSLQAFLLKYPQGLESNEARARLKELDYRVQLADSRSAAAAEHKRAQLKSKFGNVLHDIVVVPPNAPGTMFRITSGPMSKATANSTCATLEREHQSCKLVPGAEAEAPHASLSPT
jgi:hypothetical protein